MRHALPFLTLFVFLSGCSQSSVKTEGNDRDPASADICRDAALHYFTHTIDVHQHPDSVHLVFFDEPGHTTLAFFTYGWQRDLEASGDDRAYYVHFDHRCHVLSMGGVTATMEKIK